MTFSSFPSGWGCRVHLAVVLLSVGNAVYGQTATYTPSTGYLTLPSVTVLGGTTYSNVVIRLDSFAVISVGGASPGGGVAATCTDALLTLAKFNAITVGMSLDQVTQHLGCQYAADFIQRNSAYTAYTWVTPSQKFINVVFDANGNFVYDMGIGFFKVSVGL